MRPPLCVLWCVVVVMCEATDESYEKRPLNFATVIPFMNFNLREIKRKMASAINDIPKRRPPFEFLNYYEWPYQEPTRMHAEPSPTFILDAVCNTFLKRNVTAILYLSNTELYGATTASAQYFLQLAGYLGIPVICWNADNSGLEQKMSTNINLQMAPSIRDQSAAMLSILKRYKWHQFGIVTSLIAGHNDFIDAVRDLIQDLQSSFRYTLLEAVVLDTNDPDQMRRQLSKLAETETRIVLLYSTREEAPWIIGVAMELELTGKDFVWIGTHSVVGNTEDAYAGLTPGMLGINFDTTFDAMMVQLDKAIKVLAHGIELFVNDPRNINVTLQPNLSCLGHGESRWSKGEVLYNFLRNVSFLFDSERIEFNYDGTLKNAELQVRNLNNDMKWDKIGKWTADGLDIKDIVWPGNAHTPPLGIPEKFHLKVAFLEEPAFVNLAPVDPVTQQCVNRGVFCRTGHRENDLQGSINVNSTSKNSSIYQCCSGYSVDLLAKYANDLGFTFDMVRVEDGYWGTEINGKWNGLVASLLHRKADMVMTAFKVNSYRESVIDFTLPFMETGIAIVVAKRTGIISPKAFLEPFDTVSWLCILLIGIQVAAFAIFLFEWLSPTGYGMKIQPPGDHRFSLFRTYWLVWAILFGAAVNVDCPRGYTARYMANVWAMFAVVFLAIYTANLAAFMITTEEYYDLTGIDDPRLSNPFSMKPPFRFGTVPFSNSEAIVQRNQPQIYHYMKHYNKSTVLEGITAVKRGELDAFIYDATVLEYLVGQDDDCKLLTVGSWYARTGYGIGFPKFSKYLNLFNKQMMIYRENGDLERLRRFWMTGGCKPGKKERTASKPLSLEQFMSAFLLLACGFLLAGFLVLVEHIYFKYMHEHLAKTDTGGCCALISLNMGKSLTFRGAVYEAQDKIMQHRCKDPLCDIHLWKVKYELDLARLRISQLEKQLDKKHSSSNAIQYGGTSPGILRARDMTKNHVTTNEPQGLKYRDGHLYKTVATELPKQDTVL